MFRHAENIRLKPPPATAIRWSSSLAKDLRAAFLLNEGGGTTAYNAAKFGTLNGTLNSQASAWVASPYGNSWNGDGATSTRYIDIGLSKPSHLNLTGEFSIVASINPASVAVGEMAIALDSSAGFSAIQFGLSINRTTGGRVVCVSCGAYNVGNSSISAGKYSTIAATRAGSTGSWTNSTWINGVLDKATSTATNPSAQSGCAIGRYGQSTLSSLYFNGTIEYVYIWARALTAAEIALIHVSPYSIFEYPMSFAAMLNFASSGGAPAFSAKFRKSLSMLGGKIGTRQEVCQ